MRIFWFLFALLAFSACKRAPITASPTQNPTGVTRDSAQAHAVAGKHFRYVKAACKVEYQDAKNNVSFRVNLRIAKDSVIWVMVSKMGFTGMRALITPDSVRIIDYQNHQYTAAKFDTLERVFNFRLDFKMLQAVLLADMPISEYDSTRSAVEAGKRRIAQEQDGIGITNLLDQERQKLDELHLKDLKTGNLLQLFYQQFKQVDGNWFAEQNRINIDFWNKKTRQKERTEIQMEYNEVKFSIHPIEFSFHVPAKYRRER